MGVWRMRVGPWTVPDEDESRRIIFHLRYPGAQVTPSWCSANGRWHLRYRGMDLEASTLSGLMDEAEDYAALESLACDLDPDRGSRRAFLMLPVSVSRA
jgi:hypothetical protein